MKTAKEISYMQRQASKSKVDFYVHKILSTIEKFATENPGHKFLAVERDQFGPSHEFETYEVFVMEELEELGYSCQMKKVHNEDFECVGLRLYVSWPHGCKQESINKFYPSI